MCRYQWRNPRVICIELAQRRLASRSGMRSINSFCVLIFLVYHAFSLFIGGNLSDMISEHFLRLTEWNFCQNIFSQWLFNDVIIAVVLLYICIVHFNCMFKSGNKPYSLNCWKYLDDSPKTYHKNPEVAGHGEILPWKREMTPTWLTSSHPWDKLIVVVCGKAVIGFTWVMEWQVPPQYTSR